MATDTSIYMATVENNTLWDEEESNKYDMEGIAIMSVIGLGIFICGFLLGACVIWRLQKTRVLTGDSDRELEDQYIVDDKGLNVADIDDKNEKDNAKDTKGDHRKSLRDFYDNDRKLNQNDRAFSMTPL